jgi:asparagine synthetase B (glutamine-hydrolysing)
MTDAEMLALLAGTRHEAAAAAMLEESREESASVWRKTPDTTLATSIYQLHHSFPQDILTKVDRMAMAESLETRAPFLDSKLVNYALSLPAHYKLSGGMGKHILRSALKGRIPQSVLQAPKHGFEFPVAHWLGTRFWDDLQSEIDDAGREKEADVNLDAVQAMVRADREYCAQKNAYRPLHRAFVIFGLFRWRKMMAADPKGNPVLAERSH